MRGILAGAVIVAVLAGGASGGVTYQMTPLGVLPGKAWSVAQDVNNYGQVVGWSEEFAAFLWDAAGGIRPLGNLTGADHRNQYAYAINDAGQVTGYETDASWANHGYVWSETGGFQDVGVVVSPPHTGDSTRAFGINSSGNVVGDCHVYTNYRGFRYDGSMHELGSPGFAHWYARDINDAGVVVGADSGGHIVRWSAGGTPTSLDLGSGYAINNLGQVAGQHVEPVGASSVVRAAVWDADGAPHVYGILPIAGQTNSLAHDLNDRGQAVGYSRNSGTGSYDRRYACLWDPDGTIHNLNDLIIDAGGRTVNEATGINEHGQICGYASLGAYFNAPVAVLLTPSNYALAGAEDVLIDLGSGTGGAAALFSEILASGSFYADYAVASPADLESLYGPLPSVPEGVAGLQMWNAGFTGGFSGQAAATFIYDESLLPVAESELTLWHWTGTGWENLGGTLDLAANTVSVETGSFSPFVLVPEPATLALVALGGVMTLVRRRRQ